MPRARTGNVERFVRADGSEYFRARIRLRDGSRVRCPIPQVHDTTDESRERYALAKQRVEDRTNTLYKAKMKATEDSKPATRGGMTLDDYREKIAEARTAEGKTNVSRENSLWSARIPATLRHRPIAAITRDEVEDFRDTLDGEVRKRLTKGQGHGLAGKSALNVWGLIRCTFKEAVGSRDRSMRVRTDDPSAGIKPPLTSPERQKTFIYPAEFAKLMACADVPIRWREAYAVAAYLYLRPGELRALTWDDVDFDASIVHVTKATDEDTGKTKAPKTVNGIRDVPIEPALLPLLRALHLRAGRKASAPVLPVLGAECEDERARTLRAHLATAKVARARLVEDSATTKMVNFRSLRDSGITWLALASVDLTRIQRRAGHDNISTTLGYVKQAEDPSGKMGLPFAPLPFAAPAGNGPSMGQAAAIVDATAENPCESEWPLRGSNARSPSGPVASGGKKTDDGEGDAREVTVANHLAQSLARSIAKATEAGEWAIVSSLADELRALRLAEEGVVDIRRGRKVAK